MLFTQGKRELLSEDAAFYRVLTFTYQPDLITTVEKLVRSIVTSSIKHVGVEVINPLQFKRIKKFFIVCLHFLHVREASILSDVSTEWLHSIQLDIVCSRGWSVFLVLERDKEAHGEIFLDERAGSRLKWLHHHCHWNRHLDLHLLCVAAFDVPEKAPESRLSGKLGVHI